MIKYAFCCGSSSSSATVDTYLPSEGGLNLFDFILLINHSLCC
jgi:hypothetical protein